jgi:4'-phosphopantetheinyl transferase EntD
VSELVNLPSAPTWEGLFPPGVATVVQVGLASEIQLMPEEKATVARAVPARVLEFAAGRSCARAALGQLGCPPVAIPVGAQREPIWPSGFTGSITHCQGHCAAAVTRRDLQGSHPITSLGLDAEPSLPLPKDVVEMVCSPVERDWIGGRGRDALPWDRLVFSAKESVFKCVFPLELRFVDFHEVEITLASEGQFRIRAPGLPTAARQVHGCYAFRGGLIMTTAIWRGQGWIDP